MIQEAKPTDVACIAEYWYQVLSNNNIKLKFNKRALIELLDHVVSSAKHLCLITKENNEIVGCIIVTVEHFPYAEKSYAQIQFLEGRARKQLYEKFVDWYEPRKAIIAIGYSNIHDSKTPLFLKAKNFKFTGSMLIKYRY